MIASIIFAILTIMSTRGFLPRVFGTTIIPILVGLFIFYLDVLFHIFGQVSLKKYLD